MAFDTLPHSQQLEMLASLSVLALNAYDVPADCTSELINLSENATYRIDHLPSRKRWALRIHRHGYHSDMAIRSELAWLQELRSSGVALTPRPVPGRDDNILQKVGHSAMQQPRNVVLFEWEDGLEPGVDEDIQTPMQQLGEVAARMHAQARSWQRPHWFERFTWDVETSIGDTPHWGHWRHGIGVDDHRAALFGETVKLIAHRLAGYGKSPDRFGLVHCDLRLANILVDGDAVKVIDFDDSGFSWFMYDAATPVSFYEHLPQAPDLILHWIEGYQRVVDLSQDDLNEIATFVMLRRLLLVAWIGSHSETELARSMGLDYTCQTDDLCRTYLKDMS